MIFLPILTQTGTFPIQQSIYGHLGEQSKVHDASFHMQSEVCNVNNNQDLKQTKCQNISCWNQLTSNVTNCECPRGNKEVIFREAKIN